MEAKQRISEIIEGRQQMIFECSDRIWEYAETRFATKKSADEHCRILEKEGFQIERGVAHMENAFTATYGEGKPVIGILAEYDALGNMSQIADIAEKKPLIPGENGHGCGHHALGAGALAGAIGIKNYMQEAGLKGTIKFFGCPAEESGYGKAFMTKGGVFEGVDAALTWHPGDASAIWNSSSLAVAQVYFNFKGKAAHAAAAPELGRSALDAAELMNIGVNFLREHMIDQARVHYAFMDAGGLSANVVQPTASLYYFIRAPKSSQVLELYKRVEKIAKGAALMTETELEIVWDAAAADYIPNGPLNAVMYENMKLFVPLSLTEEEQAYGQAFYGTTDEAMRAGNLARIRRAFPELTLEEAEKKAAEPFLTDLMPYSGTPSMGAGSTDVGDVSWVTPTAQFMIGCAPQGTPPHSWQWVAAGKSSVMHKGILAAGKILAATAYDILTDPQILAEAEQAHKKNLGSATYKSIIPDGVEPR